MHSLQRRLRLGDLATTYIMSFFCSKLQSPTFACTRCWSVFVYSVNRGAWTPLTVWHCCTMYTRAQRTVLTWGRPSTQRMPWYWFDGFIQQLRMCEMPVCPKPMPRITISMTENGRDRFCTHKLTKLSVCEVVGPTFKVQTRFSLTVYA